MVQALSAKQSYCEVKSQGWPSTEPHRYGLAYEAGNFFQHATWLHAFGGAIIPKGAELPRLETPEQLLAARDVRELWHPEHMDELGWEDLWGAGVNRR